jgi:hypothetical protein
VLPLSALASTRPTLGRVNLARRRPNRWSWRSCSALGAGSVSSGPRDTVPRSGPSSWPSWLPIRRSGYCGSCSRSPFPGGDVRRSRDGARVPAKSPNRKEFEGVHPVDSLEPQLVVLVLAGRSDEEVPVADGKQHVVEIADLAGRECRRPKSGRRRRQESGLSWWGCSCWSLLPPHSGAGGSDAVGALSMMCLRRYAGTSGREIGGAAGLRRRRPIREPAERLAFDRRPAWRRARHGSERRASGRSSRGSTGPSWG